MLMSRLTRALVALLSILATPAWAAPLTLSGTVTYNERMALPPNAVLRVTLVDLGTGLPMVGASASLPARGQVPIAYELNVHSDLEGMNAAFGLSAEITSGDQLIFHTSRPVPIDIAAPAATTILVHPAPIHAPQPPDTDTAMPPIEPGLLGLDWTITSIGARPVSGETPLTLSIAADYRAGGSSGCNNYFTEASIEGGMITFGPAAATRMACAAEIMEQETDYFAALAAVASYELDGQGLRLLDAAGVPLIGLVRTTE